MVIIIAGILGHALTFFSASLALGSLMVNDGYKMTDVRREKNTKVDVALTPPLEGKFGFLLLFGSVRL